MTSLTMTAGKPWNRYIIIKDGKNIWNALSQLEVRAQLRATPSSDSLLISNLHTFMTTVTYDGNDIKITWLMTGQQTRDLYAQRWGNNKTGYVNIVVSDVDVIDGRAVVVPVIQLVCVDTTTKATAVA